MLWCGGDFDVGAGAGAARGLRQLVDASWRDGALPDCPSALVDQLFSQHDSSAIAAAVMSTCQITPLSQHALGPPVGHALRFASHVNAIHGASMHVVDMHLPSTRRWHPFVQRRTLHSCQITLRVLRFACIRASVHARAHPYAHNASVHTRHIVAYLWVRAFVQAPTPNCPTPPKGTYAIPFEQCQL